MTNETAVHDHTEADCMTITFAGEAYESFQRYVDQITGYSVRLTIDGKDIDASIIGADWDADDGATIRYRELNSDDEPTGDIKSAVPSKIFVY